MIFIKNLFDKKKIIQSIIEFNKKLFLENEVTNNRIILTEFSTNKSIQAGFALFLKSLQKKTGCRIFSYNNDLNLISKKKNYYSSINKVFNHNYKIYTSFKVEKFIDVYFDEKIYIKSKKKSSRLIKKITSKRKLLELKLDGIWIGDLLYDTFLKQKSKSTVNLHSEEFKDFFLDFIYLTYFWIEFFKKNKVYSVVTSHTVYTSAIPLRIALKKKLNAYQVNFHNIYRLNNNKLFAYDIFNQYSKLFNGFKKNFKIKALKIAKDQCLKRFDGIKGVDMHYSTKSAYKKEYSKNILNQNTKKKILIAAHCFLDNPHPYGIRAIFDDFYEWIDYLGKLSEKTDYDWYIKTHPDFKITTQDIIKNFVKKYPKIKLIPPNTSHHNLISNGIDCVLTVHGTIAWEYAFFKIPVISASQSNPHIDFNFSYHAKNKKDLSNALANLKNLKLNFSKENIYKFYFMNNIYRQSNWMIETLENNFKKFGGYRNTSKIIFYEFWLKYRTDKKNETTHKKITEFIDSKKFFLSREI